jgi:hypothetical protein
MISHSDGRQQAGCIALLRDFFRFDRGVNKLQFAAGVPEEWELFKVHYRYIGTVYNILALQKYILNKTTVTGD